jgi:hypothetical protein
MDYAWFNTKFSKDATLMSGNGSAPKEKESVDTGGFTPGEYRINPYYARQPYVSDDSFDFILVCDAGPSNRWHCEYHVSGTVAGYLCNYLAAYPPAEVTYQKQLALQRAYGNVSQSLLDTLVEVGELKETLESLLHPLKALRDLKYIWSWRLQKRELLNFLRTGKFHGKVGKAAFDAATSTWMEIRYGLRPLFYSVWQAVELIQALSKNFDTERIYCARGSCPLDIVKSTTGNEYTFLNDLVSLYATPLIEDFIGAYASVQYRLKVAPSWSDLAGLNVQSIPEAMWDLTRLSFVLDWWYNIGLWLSAIKYDPNVEILGNTVGLKKVRRVSLVKPRWTANQTINNLITEHLDIRVALEDQSYTRTCNERITGPALLLGDLLSIPKIIDQLIILYQSIKL